jgi:hypothetical protein
VSEWGALDIVRFSLIMFLAIFFCFGYEYEPNLVASLELQILLRFTTRVIVRTDSIIASE